MTNINFPDSPSDGEVFGELRYNGTKGVWEWNVLNGDTTAEDLISENQAIVSRYKIQYLVVAGGGGSGRLSGAGAGGYISGYANLPESFNIEIGSGGPGATGVTDGSKGSNSVFGEFVMEGGGASADSLETCSGGSSGSGGFGAGTAVDGIGNIAGLYGPLVSGYGQAGGGGGGASGTGGTGFGNSTPTIIGGQGGAGIRSSITGSVVGRAGGGGGAAYSNSSGASGGSGQDGGGNGGRRISGSATSGTSGTQNTGGGGGGSPDALASGSGGSGVVIFKITSLASVSFSVGLTEANGGSGQTVGDYKVYTVTAGTGTVTIS